jgi:hypothetical protein
MMHPSCIGASLRHLLQSLLQVQDLGDFCKAQKAQGMKSKGVPPICRELSARAQPAKKRLRLGPFQALNAAALAF